MFASLRKKETWVRYLKSLKFALYCMTHPMDGYWDLTHEKRGTMAAANTILILTLLTRVIKLKYTGFVVLIVNWEELNIITYILSVLFPLLLFVIGNWALTTLFDGKGRLGQVYMATCYGLVPYPLIQIPIMFVSNFLTVEESAIYGMLDVISLIYAAILIIVAMGQIHEYSGGKNILFTVATLFAILVMVFILMIFFGMISQGVAYFISLGRELLFRL
ncbi:MAG: YIP1 family protein [Lachnospiraceae bacterium]|nr:YIP1 family protein [Lachnospiraceae bacterium]